MSRNSWTEIEMVLTLGFYLFDKDCERKNQQLVFANMINRLTGIVRSPGSYGIRVANYVSVDPNNPNKGLTGGGKSVKGFWDKYVTNDSSLDTIRKIYNNFLQDVMLDIERNDLITSPSTKLTNVKVFNRSSKVKQDTLERANGICELCNKPAPFITKNDKPYLEVHHVVELSNDGLDITDNTLALCPNCHMKLHHSKELTMREAKIVEDILTKLQ